MISELDKALWSREAAGLSVSSSGHRRVWQKHIVLGTCRVLDENTAGLGPNLLSTTLILSVDVLTASKSKNYQLPSLPKTWS